MNEQPAFSILIANYNNGKYFKDCYDSILAQDHFNWEVIIVDDASTDDSVFLINELIKDDPRFHLYFNESNRGCGYTKRKCVEFAKGELAAFLDPDDALISNALKNISECFTNENICLVHSTLLYCNEFLKVGSQYEWAKSIETDQFFTNLDYAVTAFSAFKIKDYFKTAGINPNLKSAVDQDLYLKMSEVGNFFFYNSPLYKYRIHREGIASNNGGKAFYNHLKVIYAAEVRRGIDLEDTVQHYLSSKSLFVFEAKINNPRYLLRKFLNSFIKDPLALFIKRNKRNQLI